MKKYLYLMIALVLIVAGCGGGGSGSNTETYKLEYANDITSTGHGMVESTSFSYTSKCGDNCFQVVKGEAVTLTATPLGDSVFAGWSGGSCSGTNLTCTVTMNQNRLIIAKFDQAASGDTGEDTGDDTGGDTGDTGGDTGGDTVVYNQGSL